MIRVRLICYAITIADWIAVSLISVQAGERPQGCTAPDFHLQQFPAASFKVTDFRATGDGRTNDTAAINKAIEKCNAAGGGDVFFPAGNYSAASIHLKSNVRFVLDKNATITGAQDGYDPPEPNPFDRYQDFGHSHFRNALMFGDHIENFAIVGGRINGGHIIEGDPGSRPIGDKVIAIKSSRNLLFDGVSHDRGGHFVYLLNDCDHVTFANVTIKKSRDGVNLVGCRNVQVHDCSFTGCGDDTIAVKSDFALGRKIDSENIFVWNCYFESACNALQIGSESIGDFRNINFWSIRVGRAWRAAIGITTVHGGIVDGVNYRDIEVKNAACPIFLRVGSKLLNGTPNKNCGTIRNVTVSNVSVTDSKSGEEGWPRSCLIAGRPERPLDNIRLENIRIAFRGGGTKFEGEGKIGDSSDHLHKGFGPLPAAAFFIRDVNALSLKGVDLQFISRDARPLIVAQDVARLDLEGLTSQRDATAGILHLERVGSLNVISCSGLKDRKDEKVASSSEE